MTLSITVAVAIVAAVAVLLRLCVGLHPYSGQGKSPRFGDYEAQRHWMELTVNLPPHAWYVNSTHNDLDYWGLDYPPLTAYQSWACGRVIALFDPASMELETSHGYETAFSKVLMRWSVVLCDVLVYIPAVIAFLLVFYPNASVAAKAWAAVVALCQPPLLLIDHGHFQYNGISLGLAAAGAAAVVSDWDVLGSVLFCLSLNHKQMSLYYAPAFFAYLLGKCLQRRGAMNKLWGVIRLGLAVLLTFAAVWYPFWASQPPTLLAVLQRLAPVHRGLYEDYVANWWCISNMVIKWKQLLEQQQLVHLCAALTAVAFLPALLQQVLRPSRAGFVWCMANSAMAFYLFSYMVHEKSILLPLLPVTLLSLQEPVLASWLPAIASVSMYPLLLKDGLSLAYTGLLVVWGATACYSTPHTAEIWYGRLGWWGRLLTILAASAVHLAQLLYSPPPRLPFVYDAAYSALGFANFACVFLYTNVRQWQCTGDEKRTAATLFSVAKKQQ